MSKWTVKRRVFLEEYLKCWNATEAARRAGFKHPNVMGPRLVKVGIIQDEIKKRLQAKAMSADEVLARLADMGRGDISEFIKEHGAIDWDAVQKKGHLIKRIAHTQGKQSSVEIHDAQSALVHIGRHHALFTDRVEQSGELNIKGYTTMAHPDQWDDDDENDTDSDV